MKIWKIQLFIVIIAILKLINIGPNIYIADLFNTNLLLIFSVEVLISILLNRKLKNIFLELINLLTTIFYILRILTLTRDHVLSDLFERGGTIEKTNEALVVLIIQYFIIVIATIFFSPKIKKIEISDYSINYKRYNNFIWILLTINLFYFIFFFKLGEFGFNSFSAIFLTIFNTANLLYLIILNNAFLKKSNSNLFFLQLCLIIFIIIFSGNKSSIPQVILSIYFVILLKNGTEAKIKYVNIFYFFLLLIIFPIFYFAGNAINLYRNDNLDLDNIKTFILVFMYDFDLLIGSISYRIGFLDYFVDKLTNLAYTQNFSLINYFKAVIDGLTPGFSIFKNTQLISRAVYVSYFEISEGPNSEAITIFAESEKLFGKLSFIFYLLFYKLLNYILNKDSVYFRIPYIYRVYFVIILFWEYIQGWGIDYMIIGMVYFWLFLYISSFYIFQKKD